MPPSRPSARIIFRFRVLIPYFSLPPDMRYSTRDTGLFRIKLSLRVC